MIVKSKVQTDKNYSQTTMKLRSNTHGCELIKKKLRKKRRSVWVKPWLRRREERGVNNTLLQELCLEEEMEYKTVLRMSPETFDEFGIN